MEPKPRIIDGEPVCAGAECKGHRDCLYGPEAWECLYGLTNDIGDPCIPGLRAQRDEARERAEFLLKMKTPEGVRELEMTTHGSLARQVKELRSQLSAAEKERDEAREKVEAVRHAIESWDIAEASEQAQTIQCQGNENLRERLRKVLVE